MEKELNLINSNKSVLIAEDDDNSFYLMKEFLSDLNISIIRATNGIEVMNVFDSGQKIDLVLMDIKMPYMDGYETTKKLLQVQPSLKIIIQTAYADDENKAFEHGCLAFITKPFLKKRFISIVKENI